MIALSTTAQIDDENIEAPTTKLKRNQTQGGHFNGSRYDNLEKDQQELCEEVFRQVDIDNSGSIDSSEILSMLLKLNIEIPTSQKKPFMKALFNSLDKDGDNELSLVEFQHLWSDYLSWKTKIEEAEATKGMPFLPPVINDKKLAIFLIFDDPSSCRLAQITSILVICTIAMSVTTFVMETMPSYQKWSGGRPGAGHIVPTTTAFGVIETFSIVVFTIEYLVRFVLVGFSTSNDTPGTWAKITTSFLFHPMNVIDLLAIVPYYIEKAADAAGGGGSSALGVLRILRVARVFRVFKLGKYSAGLQMFAQVILQSMSAMILLMFFLTIAVILFGSLIYYAERGEWHHGVGGMARLDVTGADYELTPFTSIPASFWWVVTTTTTVGYGDFYPTTVSGKLVGFVTMLMGILALALPVTVIGSNFANIYIKMRDEQLAADQTGIVDYVLSLKTVSSSNEKGPNEKVPGATPVTNNVQITPVDNTSNDAVTEEKNNVSIPPPPPSNSSKLSVEELLQKILLRLDDIETKLKN